MENTEQIKGLSLRILKFLNRRGNSSPSVYGSIAMNLGLRTWEEAANFSEILIKNALVEAMDNKISITSKGKSFVEFVNRKESDEICETLFDDYDFTLLKYFYNQDDFMKLDDIPDVLKTHAPVHRNSYSTDMNFLHHVELGEMSKYIANKSQQFKINEDGIRFYKYKAKGLSKNNQSNFSNMEVLKKLITFSPQVFTIPNNPQNKRLVAVMLPFKQEKTFEAIKEVCDDLNLECKKADDIWINSAFIQDVFELIFTCEILVADVTEKNPNVFYEIGIAHTLGKTVIPITQSINDVPSDLIHHRALTYLPNKEGYEIMKEELKKRLLTLIPS
jgi:predicted transcriptional regulator